MEGRRINLRKTAAYLEGLGFPELADHLRKVADEIEAKVCPRCEKNQLPEPPDMTYELYGENICKQCAREIEAKKKKPERKKEITTIEEGLELLVDIIVRCQSIYQQNRESLAAIAKLEKLSQQGYVIQIEDKQEAKDWKVSVAKANRLDDSTWAPVHVGTFTDKTLPTAINAIEEDT